jgi:hypothetical protein
MLSARVGAWEEVLYSARTSRRFVNIKLALEIRFRLLHKLILWLWLWEIWMESPINISAPIFAFLYGLVVLYQHWLGQDWRPDEAISPCTFEYLLWLLNDKIAKVAGSIQTSHWVMAKVSFVFL